MNPRFVPINQDAPGVMFVDASATPADLADAADNLMQMAKDLAHEIALIPDGLDKKSAQAVCAVLDHLLGEAMAIQRELSVRTRISGANHE